MYNPDIEEGDSNFAVVSQTFGGELKTNLVNLISNDASEAGVMARCPCATDFQLNVFSCFFQIQFLNQQLCAKISRKQEKKHLLLHKHSLWGLCFPFSAEVTLFPVITWFVTCTTNMCSVSLIKTDKTISKLCIIRKRFLNVQTHDKNIDGYYATLNWVLYIVLTLCHRCWCTEWIVIGL